MVLIHVMFHVWFEPLASLGRLSGSLLGSTGLTGYSTDTQGG
jgi:hypothetical protein